MTLADLKSELLGLKTGHWIELSYDVFAALFPPGEPDADARAALYELVHPLHCHLENKPSRRVIWIVRDEPKGFSYEAGFWQVRG